MKPGCAQCGEKKDAIEHGFWKEGAREAGYTTGYMNPYFDHEFVPRSPLNELDYAISNIRALGRGEEPWMNPDGTTKSIQQKETAEPGSYEARVTAVETHQTAEGTTTTLTLEDPTHHIRAGDTVQIPGGFGTASAKISHNPF